MNDWLFSDRIESMDGWIGGWVIDWGYVNG